MKRQEATTEAIRRWGEHSWVRFRNPRLSRPERIYEVGYTATQHGIVRMDRVMGAGPSWERAFEIAEKSRALQAFTSMRSDGMGGRVGMVDGGERCPTLPEQEIVLALAKKHGVTRVEWMWDRDGNNQRVERVRRCDCGEIAYNDDACRLCRLLVPLIVSHDPDSGEDLHARYETADRYLSRVGEVVSELKLQLAAWHQRSEQEAAP